MTKWAVLAGTSVGLLAGLGLGCDPGVSIRGVVRTSAGQPIRGASVEVTCHGKMSQHLNRNMVTDDAGRFRFPDTIGCAERECEIGVHAPDGRSTRYTLGQFCTRSYLACGHDCSEVDVEAVF